MLLCGITIAEKIADRSEIAETYQYEGEGFGGDFTITLNADGTYAFYEGPLSSYIGGGAWNKDDDTVHMIEENGSTCSSRLRFRTVRWSIPRQVRTPSFYVDVPDGERFVRQDTLSASSHATVVFRRRFCRWARSVSRLHPGPSQRTFTLGRIGFIWVYPGT